jgi:hypothetical protein
VSYSANGKMSCYQIFLLDACKNITRQINDQQFWSKYSTATGATILARNNAHRRLIQGQNFVSQLNAAPSQKRRACVSERAARYKGEFPGKLIASGVHISSHLSPSVRTPAAICFGANFPPCVNATQKRSKLIANYFLIRE